MGPGPAALIGLRALYRYAAGLLEPKGWLGRKEEERNTGKEKERKTERR